MRNDPLAQRHELIVDDITLRYALWGEGPSLLLLHGFFGCAADFAHLFDPEALGRAHRVIAPDLRGHGGTLDPHARFSHRTCARDVWALLDHLGVQRFDAVGVSLGGNTLLHMATEQPARVRTMVTVSSPSYFPAQARTLMAQATEANASPEEWRALREKHVHGDAQIRALWQAAQALKDSYTDMNFTPPLLSTIEARTLLIAGDSDPFYPASMFTAMHEAIPRASLWVVPGGGHAPVFGEHADAFRRIVLPFLRG